MGVLSKTFMEANGSARREAEEMKNVFFESKCKLGRHYYARSLADAEALCAEIGGYVLETSPGSIWRVTVPPATA